MKQKVFRAVVDCTGTTAVYRKPQDALRAAIEQFINTDYLMRNITGTTAGHASENIEIFIEAMYLE